MIAFLILAHTDPRHVARLVSRLAPHAVFIHVDLKTPFDDEWKKIGATFVKDRIPVYWGDFSQVEASLSLIRAALSKDQKFKKLVLISGHCYPIKPVRELERLFDHDNGFNYIGRIPVEVSPDLRWMTERRFHNAGFVPWQWTRYPLARLVDRALRRVFFETIGKIRRKWTGPFIRFHGSSWWAITPECGEYLLDRAQDPQIVAAYRHALASDEQFFHSIVADSPFRDNSGPDVPFIGVGAHMGANLHIIDPALQKWFTIADIDEIATSERYFVRKVSTDRSGSLLDEIDKLISS